LDKGLTNPFKHSINLIMSKKYGVVGITKKENAQLGLLLKYIYQNDEVFNSLPQDVLQFPDDLNKLAARYANAV